MFYQPLIAENHFALSADESRHAVRVLRLKKGDGLEITDGKGFYYNAQITDASASKCVFHIIDKRAAAPRNYRIHLIVAPTKNADRMEWMVEKATELGLDEVSFMICKNSERKTINTERIEKLAISAMKQSLQAWLPVLHPAVPYKSILFPSATQKFIAHADSSNPLHLKTAAQPGGEYCLMIGPEGDFTIEELQQALDHGFQKVSLGPTRLRTETAGLAGCFTLNMVNQQ